MNKKDFLNKTYAEINDNIRFSEAKNAALITLNSALIAAAASKAFDYNIALNWRILIILLVICLMIPLIIALYSFKAKMYHEKKEQDKFMYFSYIYKHYYKISTANYIDDINNNFKDEFPEEQLSKQIVDLSSVAYRKFKLFNIAIIIEISIFSIGLITALVLAICKIAGVI